MGGASDAAGHEGGWRRSLLLPLVGLVGLAVLGVSPRGDFPLNDDWVYASSVCDLVFDQRFERHPFANAFALGLTLWGALFTGVFGFDFLVLRLSTLALALVAIWATARAGREIGLERGACLLCGALLFANPVFLNLAYTFMSDTAFVAPWAFAGLFYLRGLGRGGDRDLAIGSAFAAAAFLVRQFGALVSLVALAALLVGRWRDGRPVGWRSIAALALPWAVVLPIVLPFAGTGDSLAWPTFVERPTLAGSLLLVPANVGVCLLYLGLFLVPIAVGELAARLRDGVRFDSAEWLIALGVAAAAWLGATWFEGTGPKPLPILGNVLYDLGTGPFTLRDVFFSEGARPPPVQAPWLWWPLTAVSIGSIALLSAALASPARRAAAEPARAGQEAFLVGWLVAVLVLPYQYLGPALFDRYLLPALPPALLLTARALTAARPAAASWRGAWAMTALLLLFSLAAVQDYLAWNRARWAGIDSLIARGVPVTEIDGGFEFNGRYTLDAFQETTGTRSFWQQGRHGFWVVRDGYSIAARPRRGREVVEALPYFSFLGMKERNLFILARPGEATLPAAPPPGAGPAREPFCGPRAESGA